MRQRITLQTAAADSLTYCCYAGGPRRAIAGAYLRPAWPRSNPIRTSIEVAAIIKFDRSDAARTKTTINRQPE